MAFSALMAARGLTMWGSSTPAALCDEIDDEWNQREFSSNSNPEGSQTPTDDENILQYILPAVDNPQSVFEMHESSFNSTSDSNETSTDEEEGSQFIMPAIDSMSPVAIYDWRSDEIKFFDTPSKKFAKGVIFPSREGSRSADEQWLANAILDNLVGMSADEKNRVFEQFPFLYERFRQGAFECPEGCFTDSHYGAKANKAAAWILDRYEVQTLRDGDSTGDKIVDEELAEGLKEWDARKNSRDTEMAWREIARAEEEIIRIRGPKNF